MPDRTKNTKRCNNYVLVLKICLLKVPMTIMDGQLLFPTKYDVISKKIFKLTTSLEVLNKGTDHCHTFCTLPKILIFSGI